MIALFAFLATPAGQALVLTVVTAVGALLHKNVSESAAKTIAEVAPVAARAVEQVAKPGASDAERKAAAVDAVKAAVPLVARLVVPGVRKLIDTHVEAAVADLPATTPRKQ